VKPIHRFAESAIYLRIHQIYRRHASFPPVLLACAGNYHLLFWIQPPGAPERMTGRNGAFTY
jgi:hypothetical protein